MSPTRKNQEIEIHLLSKIHRCLFENLENPLSEWFKNENYINYTPQADPTSEWYNLTFSEILDLNIRFSEFEDFLERKQKCLQNESCFVYTPDWSTSFIDKNQIYNLILYLDYRLDFYFFPSKLVFEDEGLYISDTYELLEQDIFKKTFIDFERKEEEILSFFKQYFINQREFIKSYILTEKILSLDEVLVDYQIGK